VGVAALMTSTDEALSVDLDLPGWPAALKTAAAAAEPLVLASQGKAAEEASAQELLAALLSRPLPVTGVIAGEASGFAAVLLLACDEVFWCRNGRLRLEPAGRGEVTLLSMRLGPAAAARVWFSGGVLRRAEAVRSGWALPASDYVRALESARRRHAGLSRNALSLLRELLYRETGLPLHQAQALERASFALAFASGDPAEGIAAFLDKRRALFAPNRE